MLRVAKAGHIDLAHIPAKEGEMNTTHSVNALVQVLVETDKFVEQEPTCGIVVVIIATVVGEIVRHRRHREFLSEYVDLENEWPDQRYAHETLSLRRALTLFRKRI